MNVARDAWVEQVMGLLVSIHLRGATLPPRPAFLGEVFARLHRIDALFSTYRPGSQISRLAAGELTVTSVAWRIGVEDPRPGCGLLGVLPLTGGGVATSGTTRRGAHPPRWPR